MKIDLSRNHKDLKQYCFNHNYKEICNKNNLKIVNWENNKKIKHVFLCIKINNNNIYEKNSIISKFPKNKTIQI